MSRHHRSLYGEAQDELEIAFAAAEGMLGLHGVGFEGMATVWDDAKIHRAHMAHRTITHRMNVDKVGRVAPTVHRFREEHPEHWLVAFVTLAPHAWPDNLGRELNRGPRGGSLVGLALLGAELRRVWCKRENGKRESACRELMKAGEYEAVLDLALQEVEPTALELLRFAAREAESTDASAKKRFFDPVRREGEQRFEAALAKYDVLLRERHEANKRRAREAAFA